MRLVHWLTAAVVLVAISVGVSTADAEQTGDRSSTYWVNKAKSQRRAYQRADEYSTPEQLPLEYETEHMYCVVYQDGGPNSARLACISKATGEQATDSGITEDS